MPSAASPPLDGELAPPHGTRAERVAFWLLVALVFGGLAWTVHPWYVPSNDGAMYIATGRALARGEGYSMLGIPFQIRPPGFSVLIAPLFWLRGTDFHALNLFVSLFGALGVCLLYLVFRARLGWPLAWLVALAVWANPGYQGFCNQPMSDVPGTTLFLGCLLLERRAARARSLRLDVLLGICIGVAAYVRSVTILLVPAIFLARLCARRWPATRDVSDEPDEPGEPWRPWLARLAALALAAGLVQAPWSLRNARLDTPPPADQTLLYSYSSGMWRQDPGDPGSPRLSVGDVLGRFAVQAPRIASTLGNRLTTNERGTTQTVVTLFLVGCALVVLVRRRDAIELFVLATLGIVAFYFGYALRLMLPVYLLLLPAAVEVVRDLISRVLDQRVGLIATGVLLAGLIVLDFAPREDWEEIERQHENYVELCARYEQQLQPDARLGSQRGWHYAVFLDRPVYSLDFTIKRAKSFAAAEDVIDEYGLNTIILSPLLAKDREVLAYFQRRYGEQAGNARVYRVRP